MKLLIEEIRKKIPKLYSQEEIEDPIVCVKFFCPWNSWTWLVLEGEPELDEENNEIDFHFFGLVKGFETELGYFSLNELQGIKGPVGLTIERDLYFGPKPLSQCEHMQL